jgi:hypothetical protein
MLNNFSFFAGADKDILENCSEGEQTKIVGMEPTDFTAVRFYSKCICLYTVLIVYTPLLIWYSLSLLIFNLDRFIVSTIRKEIKNPANSFKQHLVSYWRLSLRLLSLNHLKLKSLKRN